MCGRMFCSAVWNAGIQLNLLWTYSNKRKRDLNYNGILSKNIINIPEAPSYIIIKICNSNKRKRDLNYNGILSQNIFNIPETPETRVTLLYLL